MEKFNKYLNQYFLDAGPQVFVPVIIFIFAICVKVKWQQAIKAALTIGIAFLATGMVIDFLRSAVDPSFKQMKSYLHFTSVDVGWTPLAAMAWAWKWAFLMFPIQIGINLFMLWRGWTKTLNIDLWNVWHKPFIAMLVAGAAGSVGVGATLLGFVAAISYVILELKNGDIVQPAVSKITKIKDVTVPHAVGILGAVLYPGDWILDKFKFFRDGKIINPKRNRKFGILFDGDIIGFILGLIIGLLGIGSKDFEWYTPIQVGFSVATAVAFLPLAAKFFVKSLNPITKQIQGFIQTKYKGKEIYVGLDFPVLAGSQKLWISMAIWAPITIGFAFLYQLSGSGLFPLAMIFNTSLGIPALLISGGNIRKMIALGVIYTPIFLAVGTWAAPIIDSGVKDSFMVHKTVNGALATSSGIEAPVVSYSIPNMFGLFLGKVNTNTIIGISIFPLLVSCWVLYYKGMKKRITNGYYDNVILNAKPDIEKAILESKKAISKSVKK